LASSKAWRRRGNWMSPRSFGPLNNTDQADRIRFELVVERKLRRRAVDRRWQRREHRPRFALKRSALLGGAIFLIE
jgi:RNase P protein component